MRRDRVHSRNAASRFLIFWLIITPGMWIGTGGVLGWVCHVIAAVTAYRRAERKNRDPTLA
jgi:hypothetical protein